LNSEKDALFLYCHRPGVLWYGLAPILLLDQDETEREGGIQNHNLSSPTHAQALLSIILQKSWDDSKSTQQILGKYMQQVPSSSTLSSQGTNINKEPDSTATATATNAADSLDNESTFSMFHTRNVIISTNQKCDATNHDQQHSTNISSHTIPIFVLPTPTAQEFLDRTFMAVVLSCERTLLQKQTLTAWMATLGGGYFFIKRLSHSLQLARQQRLLALQIGNISMAKQCQLNEAYNLIYAGRFREAKLVLQSLEEQSSQGKNGKQPQQDDDDDTKMLRQCHAARIFLRRLKKLGSRLKRYRIDEAKCDDDAQSHTVDDFQRIRIVVVESNSNNNKTEIQEEAQTTNHTATPCENTENVNAENVNATKSSTSKTNRNADLFDGVDDMEDALQQGRLEGMQAGKEAGFREGRVLGQVKGVDYGMELGFATGILEAVQEWIRKEKVKNKGKVNNRDKTQESGNDVAMDRIEKTCQNLHQAIQDFPSIDRLFREQVKETEKESSDIPESSSEAAASAAQDDIRHQLQRIRALTKVLVTKLGMPHHSLSSVLKQQQTLHDVAGDSPFASDNERILEQTLGNQSNDTNEW
jgi:Domain of unknown function (DUF4807)